MLRKEKPDDQNHVESSAELEKGCRSGANKGGFTFEHPDTPKRNIKQTLNRENPWPFPSIVGVEPSAVVNP